MNAVYYLYKEIYYNAFLTDKKAKKLFWQFAKDYPDRQGDEKLKYAGRSFYNAVSFFNGQSEKEKTLSELCQDIMTEYNRQNDTRKKKTANGQKNNPDGFRHYKMLLFMGLREAFQKYIEGKAEIYGFKKNRNRGKCRSFLRSCPPTAPRNLKAWSKP